VVRATSTNREGESAWTHLALALVVRLLFAGTPHVAALGLQALLQSQHEVVAVLTRPPAPRGRGRVLQSSPVAELAGEAGIDVITDVRAVSELLPEVDCCPVIAFGALIPEPLLDVPRLGWLNVHFSLLPRWRGAAPVQWAIRSGDEITGVTIFRLDSGLDTGPILATREHPISPMDTSGTLLDALTAIGAPLLVETLNDLASGAVSMKTQDELGATLAPKITTADAHIDWNQSADVVDRLIRSCTPAPGAWTTVAGERYRIAPVAITEHAFPAGDVGEDELGVMVGTADRAVRLTDVQPAGKRMMPASDWLRGIREKVRFGT
jgi:methionyl-tRNA formyltransferase